MADSPPETAASGVCNGFVGDGPHYACSLCGQIGTAHEGVCKHGKTIGDDCGSCDLYPDVSGTGQQPAAAGVVKHFIACKADAGDFIGETVVRASDYDAMEGLLRQCRPYLESFAELTKLDTAKADALTLADEVRKALGQPTRAALKPAEQCPRCHGSKLVTIRGMCGGVEMDCDDQPCPECAEASHD